MNSDAWFYTCLIICIVSYVSYKVFNEYLKHKKIMAGLRDRKGVEDDGTSDS